MGSWPQSCSLQGSPSSSLPGRKPDPVPAEPGHGSSPRRKCLLRAGRAGAGGMVAVDAASGQLLTPPSENRPFAE